MILIDFEAALNLSMLALVLLIPICFVLVRMKKIDKRATLIWQSLGLGLILLIVAALVSFFSSTDALNILVFWILHAGAYILSSLINIGIILLRKRYPSPPSF